MLGQEWGVAKDCRFRGDGLCFCVCCEKSFNSHHDGVRRCAKRVPSLLAGICIVPSVLRKLLQRKQKYCTNSTHERFFPSDGGGIMAAGHNGSREGEGACGRCGGARVQRAWVHAVCAAVHMQTRHPSVGTVRLACLHPAHAEDDTLRI